MGYFDIFKRNKKVEIQQEERAIPYSFAYNNISSFVNTQSMRLAAVYAATNMISNSVALLPIKVIKNDGDRKREIEHILKSVLNLKPNNKHNHFNFIKLLIESLLLNGNGYAYIERDDNLNVKALHLINPDYVTPMPQDNGVVKYLVSGMAKAVESSDMIHLYFHLDNTHRGISVLKYADMTLHGAYNAEKHSDNFFKSGAGLMGILKSSAPMTNEQKKQAAESWQASITSTQGGGVAILPQGLDFQSISISPEDSQLLDVRKYNVVEIARFFNISPVKLFDYTNVSYSTLEQTSMSYLQDTILPITQMMEDEFNLKLFKPSEVGKKGVDFDYSVVVATDKKTEAEYYNSLLTNGILSINDIRSRLGYEPIADELGGNAHFIQISYGTVQNVVDGAYIKQTAQTQNQQLDNKLTGKTDDEENKNNTTKKTKK